MELRAVSATSEVIFDLGKGKLGVKNVRARSSACVRVSINVRAVSVWTSSRGTDGGRHFSALRGTRVMV